MKLMKDYSSNIIERYIYIDDRKMNDNEKDTFVANLNRELAIAIQETNAYVKGRTLPFVVVRRVIKDQAGLRVIISENNIEDYSSINEFAKIKDLDISQVSHIISFKRVEPHNIIRVGDELRPGTAEVWTNPIDLIAAAVDIFLDIAMFNSVSYFNKHLTVSEKQDFNLLKLEFFEKNELSSYFIIDKKSPPSYISFAFAYRSNPHDIDYSGYVSCWEDFINCDLVHNKFPKYFTEIENPEDQIKMYKYPKHLPNSCFTSQYWENYQSGDYLLLRINSHPNTKERANKIKNYFGITECQVGPLKVVPISDYFRPDVRKDINEGNIAAIKIVI